MSASAPITLFFNRPIEATVAALDRFLETGGMVFRDGVAPASTAPPTLLFEGMTFVLELRSSAIEAKDFSPVFLTEPVNALQSSVSIKFGLNLFGGLRVPALALGLMRFAALLSDTLGAIAVGANDAQVLSDAGYFRDSVEAYRKGGAFPVLALIGFDQHQMDNILATRGLEYFAGQELVFHGNELENSEMIRRMVRLVHDLCLHGPVDRKQRVADIEPDKVLILEPDAEQAQCHVTVRFGAVSDLD